MSAKRDDSHSLEAAVTHIRRCHVCGAVNEAEGAAVMKCFHCGKHLAPFYYFDESKLDGVSDNAFHFSLLKQARNINPIWGLSTYWLDPQEETDEGHNRGNKKGKGSSPFGHSRH